MSAMTESEAFDMLSRRLEFRAAKLRIDDPAQLAQDLIDWFNCTALDVEDIERLVFLVAKGRFEAWECPTCDERVFEGQPIDWGHFQGVWQNDRVSYPGTGSNDKRCNSCRCHMVGEVL